MFDKALNLEENGKVVEFKLGRFACQVSIKIRYFRFDAFTCMGHKISIVKDYWPLSPGRFLLKQVKPNFESPNCPFIIDRCVNPVIVIDTHVFDDFKTFFCHVTHLESSCVIYLGCVWMLFHYLSNFLVIALY